MMYGDDAESLTARIREVEHRLVPEAVRLFAAGRVRPRPRGPAQGPDRSCGGRVRVSRALVSVSDKTGLEDFARGLAAPGSTIISTGGTAEALRSWGIDVVPVDEVTGYPEILGGRVKTLHPQDPRRHPRPRRPRRATAGDGRGRHRADRPRRGQPLPVRGVGPAPAGVGDDELVEQIDIGGPAMIRAAAKNHARVGVVTSPDQYREILEELAGGRRGALAHAAAAAGRRGLPAHRPLRRGDRRLAAGRRGRVPRPRSSWASTSSASCATGRTPTSGPRTTPSAARAPTCWRGRSSSTARSCRSTTCSTSTPPAACWPSSSCRPA